MNYMKNAYFNLIALVALCMSESLYAMDQLRAFENYFQNGDLWVDENEDVMSDHIVKIQNHLDVQRHLGMRTYPPIKTPPPLNDATQLKSALMPQNDIDRLYGEYEQHVNKFVGAVVCQQEVLKRLRQEASKSEKQTGFFIELHRIFEGVEALILAGSKWLAVTRESGVEHYLILEKCRPSMEQQKYIKYRVDTPAIRAEFWKYALQQALLNNWQAHYNDEHYCFWKHASPLSMLIIRHQLYKGFEGLDYKKTTEYTGPPLCRLKFKDGKFCNWPYEKLEKLLALADEEANELNTELLWK